MDPVIFIYITNPSMEEAKKMAKHLLKKKLIACANIHQVSSLYPWDGKIVDEQEFVLVAKTSDSKYVQVSSEVKKMHSYTTPCIIKIPVFPNKEYHEWLKEQIE